MQAAKRSPWTCGPPTQQHTPRRPSRGPHLIYKEAITGLFWGNQAIQPKNIIPSKVSKHCVLHRHVICKVYDLYMPCWRRHVSAHLWTLSLQHGNLNTTSDEHSSRYKPSLFSSKRTVKKIGTSRTSTHGLQQRRLNWTKETEGKRRAPKDSRRHSWSKKANFREGIFFSTTGRKITPVPLWIQRLQEKSVTKFYLNGQISRLSY